MADEAFAAKHLPDMGYDVKDFQVSHWRVGNWKKLDKKLTGPEFECGGHKWCVAYPTSFCCIILSLIIVFQAYTALPIWQL